MDPQWMKNPNLECNHILTVDMKRGDKI